MSVFKVKLQSTKQGRLDMDPTTDTSGTYGQLGTPFTVSKQRQIWVAGPNHRYRLLNDGEQFTDCNYWKQFAYPQVSLDRAFIEVVSDDGSVYSPVPEENATMKGATVTLSTNYTDTVIDFVATYGGPATFLQVQNLDGSVKISGELNGDANITFTLGAGDTQVFNKGDIQVTKLRLKGASSTPAASWVAAVKSTMTS